MSLLRPFLLAVVIFPVAEAAHEVGHLAAYSFFGYQASLLVTPWRSVLFGFQVFGVHAAPAVTPTVPVHVAVDLLGPTAAAFLLSLLWLAVPRARSAQRGEKRGVPARAPVPALPVGPPALGP